MPYLSIDVHYLLREEIIDDGLRTNKLRYTAGANS